MKRKEERNNEKTFTSVSFLSLIFHGGDFSMSLGVVITAEVWI